MPQVERVDRMRDHWWWRPGWRPGRHYYACHIAMARHPELVRLVGEYRSRIDGLPGLDLIPTPWLHLSMQGVAFVDEVTDEEAGRLVERLRSRLAAFTPPAVVFHRPVVRAEAVYLPAEPAAPVAELRAAVHSVIAEVLGDARAEPLPEDAGRFRPHVSIAYSNADLDAAPVAAALSAADPAPAPVTLDQVELLTYHRDHRRYEWTRAEPLHIGP